MSDRFGRVAVLPLLQEGEGGLLGVRLRLQGRQLRVGQDSVTPHPVLETGVLNNISLINALIRKLDIIRKLNVIKILNIIKKLNV